MHDQRFLSPRMIAGLRNFFADFFQKRQTLRLDQDTENERRMPEFFLTLSSSGISEPTLHIYVEKDMPAREVTEKIFSELIPYRLADSEWKVRRYEGQHKQQMYDEFARTGTTYYLHPAALRAIAGMTVAGDPYGVVSLGVMWGHVLLFLALVVLMLIAGEWDWSMLVGFAVILGLTYFLLNRLINLRAIQRGLGKARMERFITVLDDCQLVGQRHLNEALAVEVPVTILQRLKALPSNRPQPKNVLGASEWRLGELWDLAHEAVHELAKTPESSPQHPHLTKQVEQLLEQAALAFDVASSSTADQLKFDALYDEVTHHATAVLAMQNASGYRTGK